MANNKKLNKKVSFHGSIGSSGTLSIYSSPMQDCDRKEKERLLAGALKNCYKLMLEKGFVPPEASFMSPTDVAKKYGKTRQYWEKLLSEGKVHYKETSAGRITTDLWVQGYVNNREKRNEYVRHCKKVVDLINKADRTSGRVVCPKCRETTFDFNVNSNGNVNGLCRHTSCGFQINVSQ